MLKKITLLILVVIATSVSFVSCSKDEMYSCDPEINLWTKSNVDIIQTMTRSGLLKIDNEERQRSVLSAFTPEQKLNTWIEKVNEVMELDWNDSEMAHLGNLIDMISQNSDWFDADLNANEAKKDRYDLLTYKWTDYAKETLGWSDKLLYGIVGTPQILINKQGDVQKMTSSASASINARFEGGSGSCHCLSGSDDWKCPGRCHTTSTCNQTNSCGFMGVQVCTGKCS